MQDWYICFKLTYISSCVSAQLFFSHSHSILCLGGLSLREVVLVDGMVFDLAVLMYNSTTDDRIDFSSLSDNLSPCFSPLFLFLFWSGALLEI